MCHDGDLAFETWLFNRKLSNYSVHLMSQCLQDSRPKPRVQVCQAIGHGVVECFPGFLPFRRDGALLESASESERFLNLCFPVDHVCHNVILAL